MRIVAGKWRGRRIEAAGGTTRPTQDRVRQILFDILGPTVCEGPVLDLFAGSGSLGLEALSRGAPEAVFVESSFAARSALEENRKRLEAGSQSRILGSSVESALPRLLREGRRFRWILADPPYGDASVYSVLRRLGAEESDLLFESGGVVVETERRQVLEECYGRLRRWRVREVGGTALHFFSRAPERAGDEKHRTGDDEEARTGHEEAK